MRLRVNHPSSESDEPYTSALNFILTSKMLLMANRTTKTVAFRAYELYIGSMTTLSPAQISVNEMKQL